MNRIVREHYPVSKLPEDLREGLEGQADVRVTIDVTSDLESAEPSNPAVEDGRATPGLFSRFRHIRRANYATMDDVVQHVRALRDEWSDRER